MIETTDKRFYESHLEVRFLLTGYTLNESD